MEEIGKFHLEDTTQQERLLALKQQLNLEELMYLSTCNRVEFLFVSSEQINEEYLIDFFHGFDPTGNETWLKSAVSYAECFEGEEAINHLFAVASSLDSMVVGEREIITQVRNAYENSNNMGLTGDLIRLILKKTIETAKQIYTETSIARRPVSVVSLAYQQLLDLNVPMDARFLIVGAGQTNVNMARFLKKHGFTNFVVFNRTLANAEKLAADLGGVAKGLTALNDYTAGFDVIIACTGASEALITRPLYKSLLNGDEGTKVLIDLGIPNDIDPFIASENNVNRIAIDQLKAVANENIKEREKELVRCEAILAESMNEFRKLYKVRQVELAMHEVPEKVKEIKENAINSVFARDLEELDDTSKEVLDKIITYMEKKYISVPMKMAKEILIENHDKEHPA